MMMSLDPIRIPPPDLRYRASSLPESEETYLHIGRGGAETVAEVVASHGRPVSQMERVLDFGCSCARILQFMRRLAPDVSLFGVDVDAVAIDWCRENVPYGSFERNEPDPPLPHADGSFDFVFALSVFSHLDAAMQDAWLREIARVTKRGSLFYFTFSGPFVYERYQADYPIANRNQFIDDEFTFVHNLSDGVHPAWYQTSLQTDRYLRRHLPEEWEFVAHKGQGHQGFQDYMLVRRT
jgi:SAM-dependent methyltransferase